ncbi:MAG: hypothetical protein ACOC5M_02915 [Chloroflexota bacterium]
MRDTGTTVAIDGEDWMVNGRPTYEGRWFRGWRVEGLLLNSRMANAVFDDANPLTRPLWAYPDSGEWEPDRNVAELIEMLPVYRDHGMTGLPINLQGASPVGYYRDDAASLDALRQRIRERLPNATDSDIWAGLESTASQPWDSGAFEPDGTLRAAHMERAARVIEAAGRSGMVVILGLFYFGQDERLRDEHAVKNAVDNACAWVLARGYSNVVVEVNNECDVPKYEHEILTPPRVHELIERVRSKGRDGRRLLAGTSFTRRQLPTAAVIEASDFILLHGNGMHDPDEVAKRVDDTRSSPAYRTMPVLFNEDDHYDFDKPWNNFVAALSRRAGWGYFDPGAGAGGSAAYGDYVNGYQNPPINWGINTPRKQSFFNFLREVAGD